MQAGATEQSPKEFLCVLWGGGGGEAPLAPPLDPPLGRNSQEGVVTTLCEGHTVVLDSVGTNQLNILTYNSSLYVTLKKNKTVTCTTAIGPESVTVRVASKQAAQ